jgi:hypothetical protein
MFYAYCQDLPGVSEEMIAAVEAEVGEAPTNGLLAHVSGPMAGGWRIIDVYSTADAYQQFMRDRLGPALRTVLAGRPTPPLPAELHEVTGLDRFDRGATEIPVPAQG